ncbi:MAD2 mitotic arrest deficient-like 1 [Entophlyctis sp. JEL0112]|nr:MAD2 mitotic arrest deficient-like 1 [Entophlyctis sp. JEL0112]
MQWILAKQISKLVLVLTSLETREVVERWQFNIDLEDPIALGPANPANTNKRQQPSAPPPQPQKPQKPKTEKEITNEIAAIMRQITASVSFLPLMTEPCTFNVLTYTSKDVEVPTQWVDSDARLISKNAEQVRLRSFSTSVHKVDALVAYRLGDDAI